MSLWAIGSLLTRCFSPRATPGTARSLHSSLRDIPNRDGLRGAAGMVVATFATGVGGTFAVHYFRNDESADRKKALKVNEEDMQPRFDDWMKMNNKTYRDEEEKAMRFQLFKATVKWIESQPRSAQENMLPVSYFADFANEEHPGTHSCIDLDASEEYHKHIMSVTKYQKGEPLIWTPTMKQAHTRATHVST